MDHDIERVVDQLASPEKPALGTELPITPVCSGNTTEHCCWVDGKVCRFLEVDTMPGRHWVCGLRRQLGSWEAVHNDPGYLEHVKPVWERVGIVDCGNWPVRSETCATCGVSGNG